MYCRSLQFKESFCVSTLYSHAGLSSEQHSVIGRASFLFYKLFYCALFSVPSPPFTF